MFQLGIGFFVSMIFRKFPEAENYKTPICFREKDRKSSVKEFTGLFPFR